MSTTEFEDLMTRLDARFDNPATRTKPLSERGQITKALERCLLQVIDTLRPDCFLEIGAHEAGFSQDMKAAYPNATVVALEANPRVYAQYAAALKPTGVSYRNLAADTAPGAVTFFIPDVIAGRSMPYAGRMGSLLEVGLRNSKMTEISVVATTVDALTEELGAKRICLWIDVEGALDRVLGGAEKSFPQVDILYCEIESAEVWKEQVLGQKILARLRAGGLVPVARDCQKWFQKNVLFIRTPLLADPALRDMLTQYSETALGLFDGSGVWERGSYAPDVF